MDQILNAEALDQVVPVSALPQASAEKMEQKNRALLTSGPQSISRRGLLGNRTAQALGVAAGALALSRRSQARPSDAVPNVLVNIELAGGADGLTLCAPYADAAYQSIRGALAVPAPTPTNGVIDLDGYFGLPPGMAALHKIYRNRDMVIVHGAGRTMKNLSHFDAMHQFQTGNPLGIPIPDQNGIYGRFLNIVTPGGGPLRGIDQATVLHRWLVGGDKALAIPDPDDFDIPGSSTTVPIQKLALQYIYQAADEPVKSAAANSLAAVTLLNSVSFSSTGYPSSPFGVALSNVAKMILAGSDIESYAITKGGWDLHANLGPMGPSGTMHLLMLDLANSIRAFYDEIKADPNAPRTTLIVSSEFGRRIAPNSSAGVDHGHGQAMFIIGNFGINGPQVVRNSWPNFNSMIDVDGDLKVTIDYRDIFSELFVDAGALPSTAVATVFPGYTYNPALNLFA